MLIKRLKTISYKEFLLSFKEAVQDYVFHRGNIRAAALSYTTLISFIPIVIIISAIASKFNYFHIISDALSFLIQRLNINLPLDNVLNLIESVQSVRFKTLGFIGSIALFITFILAFNVLEDSVNLAWGIRKKRSIHKKITLYFPVLFYALILFLVITKLIANIGSILNQSFEVISNSEIIGSELLTSLVPHINWGIGYGIFFFCLWLALFYVYHFFPRGKVMYRFSVFTSLVSVFFLFLFYQGCFLLQSNLMQSYSAIYGSIAFLPLLLVLTFSSWSIILIGNEYNNQLHKKFNSIEIA